MCTCSQKKRSEIERREKSKENKRERIKRDFCFNSFFKGVENRNMSNSASNHGSGGGGGGNGSSETQVVLNVYDLTPLNHYTVWFGFGIFHSGIEGEKK